MNDKVNPVADGSATTSETLDRNSGSTDCSPQFYHVYKFTDFTVILNKECSLESVKHSFDEGKLFDDPKEYCAEIKTANGSISGMFPRGGFFDYTLTGYISH